jgi:hypothetical protein
MRMNFPLFERRVYPEQGRFMDSSALFWSRNTSFTGD